MRAAAYFLRLLLFRQAMLAPVLTYLSLVAAIYASDAGPPVPAAAVAAVALMPVSAWLTRLVTTVESAPFAEVSLVALGRPARLLLARVVAVLVIGGVLTAVTIGWAMLANPDPSPHTPHPYGGTTLPLIVAMCLAECVAGIGVGVLLAPPLRTGTAVAAVTGLVIASLAVSWLPPLSPLLRTANEVPLPAAPALALAFGQAAIVGVVGAAAQLLLPRRQ